MLWLGLNVWRHNINFSSWGQSGGVGCCEADKDSTESGEEDRKGETGKEKMLMRILDIRLG